MTRIEIKVFWCDKSAFGKVVQDRLMFPSMLKDLEKIIKFRSAPCISNIKIKIGTPLIWIWFENNYNPMRYEKSKESIE